MGGLERLGGSDDLGLTVLELIGRNGWDVARTTSFGGGVLVIAARHGYEIRKEGERLSTVAIEVLREVTRCQRLPDPQLRLAIP